VVKFLLDTNVLSELRKKERCDRNVRNWFADVDDSSVYLSILVTGEVRKGIELRRAKDPAQALQLEQWLRKIEGFYSGRILALDAETCDIWGKFNAIRPLPVIDSLLAATAVQTGMTLVTRNTQDMDGLGVNLLNPFEG
jgi:hypothetical protein